MSSLEKTIKLVLLFIAEFCFTFCFITIILHLKLENHALEMFMIIASTVSIGILCSGPVTYMISMLDKKDKTKTKIKIIDTFATYVKIQNAILEANKIIKEKGLHFRFFFETNTQYSYNNAIAHYNEYKKLSPDEYATLVYIVKREYMK